MVATERSRSREALFPPIASLYRSEPTTTSQGAIGYVGPAGANRVKGFLTTKGNSAASVAHILDTAAYGLYGMGGGPVPSEASFLQNRTRLSIRAVVSSDMMPLLRSGAKALNLTLEAAVPITPSGGRDTLVSLGFNAPERRLTKAQELAYWDFLGRGLQEAVNNSPSLVSTLRNVRSNGYQIHTQEGGAVSQQISRLGMSADSFTRLIEISFGYSHSDAMAVLQRPDNIVSLAIRGGKPAGLCVIEKIEIAIGDDKLRLAELTDVIVACPANHGTQYETHLGQKLYVALTTNALATMSQFPGYIVYGEYTLTHKTSPISSARQGQIVAGLLPNHAIIDDDPATLAVMYVPSDKTLINLNDKLREALR